MVRPGENAEFYCAVDANPMGADRVKWERSDGFDMEARTETTYSEVSRSLYLVVKNATEGDSGEFVCVADNGIGMPDAAATRPGFGLTNMLNRAQVLGGSCDITPRDDGGTVVEWKVPL